MDLSELKKQYDDIKEKYQKDLEDVSALITETLTERSVKIHSVKFRLKEFESFYNKILIKNYEDPFKDCTDIAGCRIICLFQDQIPLITKIIKDNFEVVEASKKGREKVKEFAYSSYHLVIKSKKKLFEIQIRTILQEAWAEIEHHINYKNNGLDTDVQRKINSLAALFEIADDQFFQIHQQFLKLTKKPATITKEINGILLYNYCKNMFPWAWEFPEYFKEVNDLVKFEKLAEKLKAERIFNLKELNELYEKYKDEIVKDEKFHVQEVLQNPTQWPSLYNKVKSSKHFYGPLVIMGMLLNQI